MLTGRDVCVVSVCSGPKSLQDRQRGKTGRSAPAPSVADAGHATDDEGYF